MKKFIKTLAVTLMISGIIFAVGTAGSADLNAISWQQTITQGVISLAMMLVGYAIIRIMQFWEVQ